MAHRLSRPRIRAIAAAAAVALAACGREASEGAASAPVAAVEEAPAPAVAEESTPAPAAPVAADDPSIPVGLEVGNRAPDFEAKDLQEQRFKLSDYRGKIVVLDFWGFW